MAEATVRAIVQEVLEATSRTAADAKVVRHPGDFHSKEAEWSTWSFGFEGFMALLNMEEEYRAAWQLWPTRVTLDEMGQAPVSDIEVLYQRFRHSVAQAHRER